LTIEVRDNGGGFTPEALQRAATPFYTTRNVGLGLGLAVSRRIIGTHHGKLEIVVPKPAMAASSAFPCPAAFESERRSCAWIDNPALAKQSHLIMPTTPMTETSACVATPAPARRRTLLIVDDEEGPRQSLRVIFKDDL